MELTDQSQSGGVWGGPEEISHRTYMRICIVHGHRQQFGEGQVGGTRAGWKRAKRGKIRDICNSGNNRKRKVDFVYEGVEF